MKTFSESLLIKKRTFTLIRGCEIKNLIIKLFEDQGVLREIYFNVLQLTDCYGTESLKVFVNKGINDYCQHGKLSLSSQLSLETPVFPLTDQTPQEGF